MTEKTESEALHIVTMDDDSIHKLEDVKFTTEHYFASMKSKSCSGGTIKIDKRREPMAPNEDATRICVGRDNYLPNVCKYDMFVKELKVNPDIIKERFNNNIELFWSAVGTKLYLKLPIAAPSTPELLLGGLVNCFGTGEGNSEPVMDPSLSELCTSIVSILPQSFKDFVIAALKRNETIYIYRVIQVININICDFTRPNDNSKSFYNFLTFDCDKDEHTRRDVPRKCKKLLRDMLMGTVYKRDKKNEKKKVNNREAREGRFRKWCVSILTGQKKKSNNDAYEPNEYLRDVLSINWRNSEHVRKRFLKLVKICYEKATDSGLATLRCLLPDEITASGRLREGYIVSSSQILKSFRKGVLNRTEMDIMFYETDGIFTSPLYKPQIALAITKWYFLQEITLSQKQLMDERMEVMTAAHTQQYSYGNSIFELNVSPIPESIVKRRYLCQIGTMYCFPSTFATYKNLLRCVLRIHNKRNLEFLHGVWNFKVRHGDVFSRDIKNILLLFNNTSAKKVFLLQAKEQLDVIFRHKQVERDYFETNNCLVIQTINTKKKYVDTFLSTSQFRNREFHMVYICRAEYWDTRKLIMCLQKLAIHNRKVGIHYENDTVPFKCDKKYGIVSRYWIKDVMELLNMRRLLSNNCEKYRDNYAYPLYESEDFSPLKVYHKDLIERGSNEFKLMVQDGLNSDLQWLHLFHSKQAVKNYCEKRPMYKPNQGRGHQYYNLHEPHFREGDYVIPLLQGIDQTRLKIINIRTKNPTVKVCPCKSYMEIVTLENGEEYSAKYLQPANVVSVSDIPAVLHQLNCVRIHAGAGYDEETLGQLNSGLVHGLNSKLIVDKKVKKNCFVSNETILVTHIYSLIKNEEAEELERKRKLDEVENMNKLKKMKQAITQRVSLQPRQ